uniref:NUC153 domain-containing protein n=1 Tax=Corethron hystrix TaxID=216773 RepID=A0A7S1B7Y8_9STRA|mmetsp:Transcript_1619/g.3435  ORF Transcript_1619/g.3435 Transcript_1619/m.3435 type:complete len:629 (+) Transcript_1619:64-1950(+)
MRAQQRNSQLIYSLHSSGAGPSAAADPVRRNRSRIRSYRDRSVDILQDFCMPSHSGCIVGSPDGRYVLTSGGYKPRVKVYDTADLGLKFERYLDGDVTSLSVLGSDYGKFAALMGTERLIEFHAPYGRHYEMRIPTAGRAALYDRSVARLYVAGGSGRGLVDPVYCVDLVSGAFREPLTSTAGADLGGAASLGVSVTHGLMSVGYGEGSVRFWDTRSHRPVVTVKVGRGSEATCLAHGPCGTLHVTGTEDGRCVLHDLRSERPLGTYEMAGKVHTVHFHTGSETVLSGDGSIITAWRYKGGKICEPVVHVETTCDNDEDGGGFTKDFLVAGDASDPDGRTGGIILTARDGSENGAYYVPVLGKAPEWAKFLDSVTEELEEKDADPTDAADTSAYDNHKFLSNEEIEKLGVSNLIGTPLLRAHLHGFLMDTALYTKVRSVADPFEYESYRKKKIREKLAAKAASRIAPRNALKKKGDAKPAVNADLRDRLEAKAAGAAIGNKRDRAGRVAASNLLKDARFGQIFDNPDFQVEEESEEFKQRHGSGAGNVEGKDSRIEDMDSDEDDGYDEESEEEEIGFSKVRDADYDDEEDEDDETDSDSDDDDADNVIGGKVSQIHRQNYTFSCNLVS